MSENNNNWQNELKKSTNNQETQNSTNKYQQQEQYNQGNVNHIDNGQINQNLNSGQQTNPYMQPMGPNPYMQMGPNPYMQPMGPNPYMQPMGANPYMTGTNSNFDESNNNADNQQQMAMQQQYMQQMAMQQQYMQQMAMQQQYMQQMAMQQQYMQQNPFVNNVQNNSQMPTNTNEQNPFVSNTKSNDQMPTNTNEQNPFVSNTKSNDQMTTNTNEQNPFVSNTQNNDQIPTNENKPNPNIFNQNEQKSNILNEEEQNLQNMVQDFEPINFLAPNIDDKLEKNNLEQDKQIEDVQNNELNILNNNEAANLNLFSTLNDNNQLEQTNQLIKAKEVNLESNQQEEIIKKSTSSLEIFNTESLDILTDEEVEEKENLIVVENLKKSFKKGKIKTEVLSGVNFTIPKGEITTIVGPSGSGKTTILNLISGLDSATKGSIMFDEEEVVDMTDSQLLRYRLENIGFVFQSYNLIPNMTIYDNVKMTADLAENPMDVQEVLELVGLGTVGNKYPHQLSGGMQQRTSFARAIVKNPKVLVCDEPTGALDEKTGKDILQMITDLVDKINSTIIIVTHNPGIKAMSHSVIEVKDGKIFRQYHNRHQINAIDVKWA